MCQLVPFCNEKLLIVRPSNTLSSLLSGIKGELFHCLPPKCHFFDQNLIPLIYNNRWMSKKGSLRFEFDNKSHFFTSAINRTTTTTAATVLISLISINKLESVQVNVGQKIVSGIRTTWTDSAKLQQP